MARKLRNELITLAYGDLAEGFVEVFDRDVTWPAFGQWASHTVGGVLDRNVPLLGAVVSRSFAHGNQAVFADIGSASALFLEIFGPLATLPGTERAEAIAAAWPGFEAAVEQAAIAPPGLLPSAESSFWSLLAGDRTPEDQCNDLLAGFRLYTRALAQTDTTKRSQLVLAGNVVLAAHEQRVLTRALSLGFREWLRACTRPNLLMMSTRSWRRRLPTDRQLWLEAKWIALATKHVVAVRLPWQRVRVGQPVPPGVDPVPIPSPRGVSGTFATLEPEAILAGLALRFNLSDEPATCWNDFDDRMRYIMALFAQHQRSPQWFDQGRLLRPDPWRKLESGTRALTELVSQHQAEPRYGRTGGIEAKKLREVPTAPAMEGASLVDLSAIDRDALRPHHDAVRADVRTRLEQLQQPGNLLDDATCRAARRLFRGNETFMFLGLFVRALPEAYASAAGATVVGTVSDLNRDPLRRASETAQFVADLLKRSNSWDEESLAFLSVCGVRTMHTIVAAHLEAQGWDADQLGVPVNAEDVVGTALSFAVPVFEMYEEMGIPIAEDKCDAYVRFWLGVGVLLGAPAEAVLDKQGRPPTFRQAQQLAEQIRDSQRLRSLHGVRLHAALIDGIAEGLPRGLGWFAPGLSQAVGDDEVSDMLLTNRGPGEGRSEVLAHVLSFGLRHRPTRKVVRLVIAGFGRWALKPFFTEGLGRPYRRPQRKQDRNVGAAIASQAICWPEGMPTSLTQAKAGVAHNPSAGSRRSGQRRLLRRQALRRSAVR